MPLLVLRIAGMRNVRDFNRCLHHFATPQLLSQLQRRHFSEPPKKSKGRHVAGKDSRITEFDRSESLADKWKRVNEPAAKRQGSVSGLRMDVEENPYGKSAFHEARTVTGNTTEHPYQVSPVYPRQAAEQTTKQRKVEKKTLSLYKKYGSRQLFFFLFGILCVIVLNADMYWWNRGSYFVPYAVYSSPQYADLKITHVVYLDIASRGVPLGRIHIGLFHKAAPHWCENFHRLCTGENPGGKTLTGTEFWKCTGPSLYGGDTQADGCDGLLAFDQPIPEDTHNNVSIPFGIYPTGVFTRKLSGMNDSNFFIALNEGRTATHGDFTCAGMVLKGHGVVEKIASLPREPFPYFLDKVEIQGCGVSPLSGNEEVIDDLVKRYHKGRTRRFLATHVWHREAFELAGFKADRREKLKEKREQIEQELGETRLAAVAVAEAK